MTARACHLVTAVIVVASLVAQLALTISGTNVLIGEDGEPAPTAERVLRFFSYFTVQSNIVLAVGAVTLLLSPLRDGIGWRVLRLDGVLGITVTGLIFVTVLLPIVELEGLAAWTNAGMHYAAPLLGLGGWLLFGPRPRVDSVTLARAVIWPVAWIAYVLILGEITAWYPYPFVDVNEHGYMRVLLNIVVVFALGLALLGLFKWWDNRVTSSSSTAAERQGR